MSDIGLRQTPLVRLAVDLWHNMLHNKSKVYSKSATSCKTQGSAENLDMLYSLLYDLLSNKSAPNRSRGGRALSDRMKHKVSSRAENTVRTLR